MSWRSPVARAVPSNYNNSLGVPVSRYPATHKCTRSRLTRGRHRPETVLAIPSKFAPISALNSSRGCDAADSGVSVLVSTPATAPRRVQGTSAHPLAVESSAGSVREHSHRGRGACSRRDGAAHTHEYVRLQCTVDGCTYADQGGDFVVLARTCLCIDRFKRATSGRGQGAPYLRRQNPPVYHGMSTSLLYCFCLRTRRASACMSIATCSSCFLATWHFEVHQRNATQSFRERQQRAGGNLDALAKLRLGSARLALLLKRVLLEHPELEKLIVGQVGRCRVQLDFDELHVVFR